MKLTYVAAAGVLTLATAVAGVGTSNAEVSLKGKTVSIIINSKAGGGTDATARLLGGALGLNLPGKPQVIFRNMPGGGGLKANNYFYSKVKPDGLTAIAGSRTQISPTKLLGEQARYDPSKYKFIGGDAYTGVVFLLRADAQAGLLDPKAKTLTYGDVDGTRSGVMMSMWAKEYLGWNLRYVVGYSGSPAIILGARSGELQMMSTAGAFNINPLIESGEMIAIAQMGLVGSDGERRRRKDFSKVPVLSEMLIPKLPPDAKVAYDKILDDMIINKWMALPPGTPDEIVEAYRAAFMKASVDPALLKIVHQEIGEDYTPLNGAYVQQVVSRLVKVTKDDLDTINALKKKNGLPLD